MREHTLMWPPGPSVFWFQMTFQSLRFFHFLNCNLAPCFLAQSLLQVTVEPERSPWRPRVDLRPWRNSDTWQCQRLACPPPPTTEKHKPLGERTSQGPRVVVLTPDL